jgi:cell division septum initiation protein DivIVA
MAEDVSSKEIGAVIDDLVHEARRYRARFALVDKLASVKRLLAEEELVRAGIADLKLEAERIADITAAGDDIQRRLDNLDAEFANKEALLLKRATGEAEEIVSRAWREAEAVGLNARQKVEQAARLGEEQIRRSQGDLAMLDQTIAERERRLREINAQIEKLRAKIADD